MNSFPPLATHFSSASGQPNQASLYEAAPPMPSLSPQGTLPPPSALTSAPSSRPGSGLQMAYLLHPPAQQGPALPLPPTSSPYAHSYDSGSGSPADRASVVTDGNGSLPDAPSHVSHMAGAAGQPQQKRAYRQRRKDPSCDACRERKVKCDASESSSCTECSNRKVRCQFTKETNRRMSSIKQVQDLEKQLTSTKQQLQQLRSGVMKADNVMDIEFDMSGQPVLKLPDIGHRPVRQDRPLVSQDFSTVRANVRNHGYGIIKVPPPYRHVLSQSLVADNGPALPARGLADRLLAQYHTYVHTIMPIIHWPSFYADYEALYQRGTLRGTRREWAAVFFGVLACGVLHTLEPNKKQDAQGYLLVSQSIVDMWTDDFTLDQARVSLLSSIALNEMNSRSSSWVWLGSAVRIAQDIGLHIESGPWSVVEREMRRRLWWGIYAWDRLLCLELGKPISIHDQDCDVDLPCPVDEQYISDGARVPEASQTNPLLATIHVVRSIGQLTKTLRSPMISPATLEIFDRHFNACLATFPIQFHPKSDNLLDPSSLAPIIYLQNARYILHRHNISPYCPAEVRFPAFDQCLSIAQDTARVLSRCMHSSPPTGPTSAYAATRNDWQTLLASSATTILCTHIWRCLLILIFREDFAAASVCVQACKAIGDHHVAMEPCGRFITFFLKCLLDRLRHNDTGPIDRDEEMIAYVSGDMQSTSTGSWVWQGSETGSQLESMSTQTTPQFPSSTPEGMHRSSGESEWEGWDWIDRTIQYLASEQHQRSYERRDVPAVVVPQAPELHKVKEEPMPKTGGSPSRSSAPNSRMTIANII